MRDKIVLFLFIFAAFAFVLGRTFGPRLLEEWRARNLLTAGAPATARILLSEDTGNRFNANPEVRLSLEVSPPGSAPFAATVTVVVPTGELSKYQPGATVEVRYDPKDRTRVAVVPSAKR